ncbi:MAG TPA: PKD domain-containing protein [Chitinophagaceae bacterium]|nr:PKD domain-containing protein [Chitinophagaceae bacterium]
MKKLLVFAFVIMLTSTAARAGHISGGEIYYEYVGPGSDPNFIRYRITLRLFRECNPATTSAAMPLSVILGIYSRGATNNYALYLNPTVNRTEYRTVQITPSAYPCIIPPPNICYFVGQFTTEVDLPQTQYGFVVSFQTCCRTSGILNMQGFDIPGGNGFFGDGATYIANIPGTNTLGPAGTNKSPVFDLKDTAVVCANNQFTLPFSATDPDGDTLRYSFCSAFDRGASIDASNIIPSYPPYNFISYVPPFNGSSPLGNSVTINPNTGIITGIAPAQGKYVVNVCIDEIRGGVKISEHRKDFILEVKNCQIASAGLQPQYLTCDGFTMNFENLSNSPLINSWYWDFGVNPVSTDTSTQQFPTYTYADSGTYTMKLIVNKGQQCSDSTTAIVKVYPGFFPDFNAVGSCKDAPFQFLDATVSNYGNVTGWRWDFGDLSTIADTSQLKNPTWKYSDSGTKQIRFIVGNTKGCIDTVFKDVVVYDKPLLDLPFQDTLICSVDTLQLQATGIGNFAWTPTYNIINETTPTPLVYPKVTTTYTVTLNDKGCVNSDTVRVRVVDFVTLGPPVDTTICLTDSAILRPVSDGLKFTWTPAATLDDPNKKNPVAIPTATTTYFVLAEIGKCSARDSVLVRTVPYPGVAAGPDDIICYEDTSQLNGSIVGTHFTWAPASSLSNPNSLTPLAFPLTNTTYILTAHDSLSGCPKPSFDTVIVTVRPKIIAFAGNDTSVVVGQPLQLHATGGMLYTWTPATFLSSDNVANPIAILNDNMTYILRAYTPEDCEAFDTINIKVFKTNPDIFVPNAFTPGKGRNNLFRPIPVGISEFNFFRVYNRWGQLVFSSSEPSKGWDGTIGGKPQDTGTYVWMVRGTDFTGKVVFKKGTMVLLR